MFITNVISGEKLGQLEKLLEENYGKNNHPTISINTLEYVTTYKNGRLAIKVSVKVDEDKMSPEELEEVKQIINSENNSDQKPNQISQQLDGDAGSC